MWPFRRHITLEKSGFFQDFTDWHSHILPGVDDGVQSMEEALRILAGYERLGVREVWLTPHVMEDIPNTTQQLRERLAELRAAYKGNVILHLASEYMLDSLFEERLERNDVLPLGEDGRHLLVETSYYNPPVGLRDILLRIKSKGYYPVLAHPERYQYMERRDYGPLKAMGVKFQMNLLSLFGSYGQGVRKKAEWLLRSRAYELAGTDIHGDEWLEIFSTRPLGKSECQSLETIKNQII